MGFVNNINALQGFNLLPDADSSRFIIFSTSREHLFSLPLVACKHHGHKYCIDRSWKISTIHKSFTGAMSYRTIDLVMCIIHPVYQTFQILSVSTNVSLYNIHGIHNLKKGIGLPLLLPYIPSLRRNLVKVHKKMAYTLTAAATTIFVLVPILLLLHSLWKPSRLHPLPPGPKKLPIVENMFDIPTGARIWLKYAEMCRKYSECNT